MAKKAAVKEQKPKAMDINDYIAEMSVNMTSLMSELEKASSVASAAKRARLLTSTLTKQFKEFRAVSVAHFKK